MRSETTIIFASLSQDVVLFVIMLLFPVMFHWC